MTNPAPPGALDQERDRRIGRLEGIAEQLDRRLEGIERAISELRTSIRWVVGILVVSQMGVYGLLFTILSKG